MHAPVCRNKFEWVQRGVEVHIEMSFYFLPSRNTNEDFNFLLQEVSREYQLIKKKVETVTISIYSDR